MPPRIDVGQVIADRYELARPLGRGSMGEVWVAHHRTLDEDVALKLLTRAPAPAEIEDPSTALARFRFEAQVAARLSRKTRHIVRVTDNGEEDGLPYLVMELLEGETLASRLLRSGPFDLAMTSRLVAQIARALTEAHDAGVVHRDLKPANVFLTRDEDGGLLVKLLDFGIARTMQSHRVTSPFSTAPGLIFGTPGYMSPEQAFLSSEVDHRCDLWALATIAYEALTNELPVAGAHTQELLANLCAGRIVSIHERNPALPGPLGGFFARAFASNLAERFASAAELSREFEQASLPGAGAPRDRPVAAPDLVKGNTLSITLPMRPRRPPDEASPAARARRRARDLASSCSRPPCSWGSRRSEQRGARSRCMRRGPPSRRRGRRSKPSGRSMNHPARPCRSNHRRPPIERPRQPPRPKRPNPRPQRLRRSSGARDPAPRGRSNPHGSASFSALERHAGFLFARAEPRGRAFPHPILEGSRARGSERDLVSLRPIARAVTSLTRRNVRLRGALSGLLLGAVHVWTPNAARADDAADAKDLFAQGRQLRAHGDCTNALPLFRKAYAIYPVGLGSLRNLAECQEAVGHFASARGAWLDLGRALQQHAEPRYAGWDQDAERGAARLASKVATLTVEVTGTPSGGAPGPDGLDVTLNGKPLSPSLLGTALERDPGKVLIRVTGAQIGAPREQWVELSEGQVRRVVVDLSVAPAPPSHQLAKDKAERTAAWVGIGVGAAGLVGAGIAALVRQSALDELRRDHCEEQTGGALLCRPPTPPTAQETVDRGRVATTLANVFAVVGGASLAGGLVLLAVTPSRSPTATAFVLSPSGVSAIGRF